MALNLAPSVPPGHDAAIRRALAGEGGRDVLLVEAGPDCPDASALSGDLRDGTKSSMRAHDWGFVHRPVESQVLFDLPRGKVVGGSSAVNTCIALRGQPYDSDDRALRAGPRGRAARFRAGPRGRAVRFRAGPRGRAARFRAGPRVRAVRFRAGPTRSGP